ncbi:MAG: DNA polymerase III subunit delta [Clostridiales bacterium]|nr:DNA polymerase III subunit delta [Clostridiales bacterium]
MSKIKISMLKEIVKTNPVNVYLFDGSEGYLKKKYLDKITSACVDESFADFNLHIIDGSGVTVEEIAGLCEAMPVMSETKCVVVKDYDFEDYGAKQNSFEELLKDFPPYCALVFYYAADFSKTADYKSLVKLIEKYGYVVNFETAMPADIKKYLEDSAKKRSRSLAPGVSDYLIKNVSGDLNTLTNEIDKLCAYCDSVITQADVDRLCAIKLETTVFKMLQDLTSGYLDKALKKLNVLFVNREDETIILGAVISQYADMLRAKASHNTPNWADKLSQSYVTYNNSFRLERAAQNASKLTFEQIAACLEILANADKEMKSGLNDKKILLEKTIIRLYRVRKPEYD